MNKGTKGSVYIKDGKLWLDFFSYNGASYGDECSICGKRIKNTNKSNYVEISVDGEIIGYADRNGKDISFDYPTSESQGSWLVGNECFRLIEKLTKQIK